MANIKVSELPTTNVFNDADYAMLVQSGENKKIVGSDFKESLMPVVLYSNDEGTLGDITLSDNSANYRYIEVFFREGSVYNSSKVYQPNGKRIALISQWTNASTYIYYETKTMTFDGTSLYLENPNYRAQVRFGGSSGITINDVDVIAITRVLGYK